ncbi:DUF2339 domain-containing protein [Lysinibacillus sphaericus]|uniref:Membrane protein, putative n=1 Tax=Lysinibacillus sphaericus TaxID=1421 RepID=A0A2S0K3B4_LYSSH|nr:DUF2339 domain-containing protein [Lysinibacillus sphaericus]AVK97836.1 hypothetical protein LS41612_16885 [Lysinibacillus sphaericus]MED4543325.1 DUF2339 domain-containing protein [Lysinibacillus sphaericus]TKI21070.1 DUF2339 domain-containing protein [Lysinibacillus sphaericus]SUV16236.1 putative membrane protein, putative [Lysinibacillus sphaericus]GEC81905.1 hypothetical protein LSP03_16480 [Lysinibacillus sphaericus]
MSLEMEQRIAKLEKEMVALRREMDELKHQQSQEKTTIQNINKSITGQSALPIAKAKPTPPTSPIPTAKTNVQQGRSIEEQIMWALPKVFMVILVLGVLWGLKLVSDYGYLSNEVKIILAYLLSIALATIAYVAERKKLGSSAVTISLYGGAFIVGILTTAAGAMLYDVLGLTLALFIAILFIGYGIAISYLKKNEVLTLFVSFTSLLLPYLLEYMDFSAYIILFFVIVLFTMLQFVILQHKQKIALYVATFFSILAISIVAFMNNDNQGMFALGLFMTLAIFYTSWCRLYNVESKWKHIYVGLQFSLGIFSLLMMNLISSPLDYKELLLFGLCMLFIVIAGYGYKQKWQEAFDSAVTLAFITLCNTLLIMNIPEKVDDLLLPFILFAGVMMSLRLRASMMKVVSSIGFVIALMMSFIIHEPTPFFSIEHIALLMPGVYLFVIYMYALRRKETLNAFEKWMKDLYVLDIIAVITASYFIAYIGKLDSVYIVSASNTPHLMSISIVLLFVVSLFLPVTFKGRALTPVLTVLFLLFTFMLNVIPSNIQGIEWLNIMTRLTFIATIKAIILDLLMKGRIYRIYQDYMPKFLDAIVSIGVVSAMLAVCGLVSQLAYNDLLDWKLSIALTTITLFLTASLSLWLGAVRHLRILRLSGFIILAIAFIKLIFFDLSALDLLIRAILFISIGGIGMLLSGRLLRK